MADNPWQLPKPEPFNPIDWGLNFLGTPVYNTSKLLADVPGLENVFGPIRDAGVFDRQEDFQVQHPFSAGSAEFASWLIPGIGWAKATSKLPAISKGGQAVAAGTKNPLLGVAAAETLRWAPFSVAPVAAKGLADRYEDWTEPATELFLNLGLGALSGGLGPKINPEGALGWFHVPAKEWYGIDVPGTSTFGRRETANLKEVLPGFTDINPYQVQARQIAEGMRDGLVPKEAAMVELPRVQDRIIAEAPLGASRYAEFSPDGTESIDKLLNMRLYKIGSSPTTTGGGAHSTYTVPRVFEPDKTPKMLEGLTVDDIGTRLGYMPEFEGDSWLNHVRFPRIHVESGKVSGGKAMPPPIEGTRFAKQMTTIDPGKVWIAREPEAGMWHVVQKMDAVVDGSRGKSRYLVYKTDQPDKFLGKYADPTGLWRGGDGAQLKLGANAWNGRVGAGLDGGSMFNNTRDMYNAIPLEDWRVAMKAKDKGTFTGIVKKAFGENDVSKKTAEFLDRYVRPAAHQFRHPLALKAYMTMSAMKDNTTRAVRTKIEGLERKIWALWQAGKGEDFIQQAYREQRPLDQITDPEIRALTEELRKEGRDQISQVNMANRAVGNGKVFPIMQDHLGVSRVYEGDYFIPLKDANGQIRALAAGNTEAQTKKRAAELAQAYANRGEKDLVWDPSELVSRDKAKTAKEFRFVRGMPGFANPRGNVGGYKWDIETPNADEFISALNANYEARNNYQLRLSLDYFLGNDLAKLRELDPHAYETLESRFRSLVGESGPFERWQNAAVDKAMSPVLGQQGATKIANAITMANHHLQLGMGNVAYALLNVLSIPTQLPAEASMMLTASAPKLGQMYGYYPTAGADGKLNGMIAMPKTFAVMKKGMDYLRPERRPDKVAQVFARAEADGLHDPQFIEEWSGRMRASLTDLQSATGSGAGFARWLGAASNFMGAQTEKFMRSYAIGTATATVLTRWPTIPDEQLYQYVKRFVGRTAFEYNRYSRPEVFTTPIGQVFGGFKTWAMNYMHVLGDYGAEAGRGNFAPLMLAGGMTGLLGGMAALPFLPQVADALSETLFDQDAMTYLYDNFDPMVGDALYFGLPSVLTGVSATGNISLPGSHIAHDAEMMFGVASLERAKNMARSLGSVFDAAIVAGVDPFQNPKVAAQIMQGWTPKSFYRTYQTFQDGAEGGLVSPTTGYPTVEGMSPYSQAMYMLGFTPTEVERQYRVYDIMMKDKNIRRERTSTLGEAWAQAQVAGDRQSMELIARRAAAEGVDLSSVLRSANRRIQEMQQDQFGRNFSPEEVASWDSVLGD